MTEPVTTFKGIIGMVVAAMIAPVATNALRDAEGLILGVPPSVLWVALAGTLIGVLLLPEEQARRLVIGGDWHLWLQIVARALALVLFVTSYALLAAWVVMLAVAMFPALAGAPMLPMAGISGALIRRLLPRYINAVERAADALGAKK